MSNNNLPDGRSQDAGLGDWTVLTNEGSAKVIDQIAAESKHLVTDNRAELHGPRADRGTPPIQLHQYEDNKANDGPETPLTGLDALVKILNQESWNKFGFVVFRTSYRDETLWERFCQEFDAILRQGLDSATTNHDMENILEKLHMEVVSDDCMENKIPAHIALAYRMFDDVDPGLKTKMCLIVDDECMESVTVKGSQSVPFVKAADVLLGADSESAFPRVIRVAIPSLLARFYPALANCDTVWEIAPEGDEIWCDWPGLSDDGGE